jgi:DNA repair protein RadA/Sms
LGEVRPVPGLDRRLREAARLGFRKAIVPPAVGAGAPVPKGLRLLPVQTLREALEVAFRSADSTSG